MSAEPKSLPDAPPSTANASGVPTVRRECDYVGQTLGGRYLIVRPLGRGGMGAVFLGKHVAVGRPVAVKILNSELVTEQEGSKRLFREARAAAAIGHSNIIDVLDVGVSLSGDPYLVMEYLEGEDLASLARRKGPLSLAAACGIFEPILLALQAAHAKGIIHRDLKPANIFLVRREDAAPMIKLIDFGISKVLGNIDQARITVTGAMLGTPAYMAPEQARGEEDIDARADLYAVGIMLFQVIAGRLPFTGTNYNDLIFKILNEDVELPPSKRDELPERARTLIQRAISKDPANRQQSARELLDDLSTLDAWENRVEGLTQLAAHIHCAGVTSDDLDAATQISAESSSVDPIAVPRDAIAADLVETKLEGARSATPAPKTGAGSVLVAALAALLVSSLFGLAVYWRSAPGAPTPTPGADQPAAALPAPDGVEITIAGLPEDAVIRYDGAPVSMNPFRVKAGRTIVPIRVEAPGHEPFVTTVVPSADTMFQVDLLPSPGPTQAQPADSAEDAADGGSRPGATKSRRPQRRPGTIGKSGRDTLYSEKFE